MWYNLGPAYSDLPSTRPRRLFYEYLAQTAIIRLTWEITYSYLLPQNYYSCLFVSDRHYAQRLIA